MVESILAIIAAALTIWEYKEKRKYIDQMNSLKAEYYAEQNKPDAERSDLVLDIIEHKIGDLAKAIALDMNKVTV